MELMNIRILKHAIVYHHEYKCISFFLFFLLVDIDNSTRCCFENDNEESKTVFSLVWSLSQTYMPSRGLIYNTSLHEFELNNSGEMCSCVLYFPCSKVVHVEPRLHLAAHINYCQKKSESPDQYSMHPHCTYTRTRMISHSYSIPGRIFKCY